MRAEKQTEKSTWKLTHGWSGSLTVVFCSSPKNKHKKQRNEFGNTVK